MCDPVRESDWEKSPVDCGSFFWNTLRTVPKQWWHQKATLWGFLCSSVAVTNCDRLDAWILTSPPPSFWGPLPGTQTSSQVPLHMREKTELILCVAYAATICLFPEDTGWVRSRQCKCLKADARLGACVSFSGSADAGIPPTCIFWVLQSSLCPCQGCPACAVCCLQSFLPFASTLLGYWIPSVLAIQKTVSVDRSSW